MYAILFYYSNVNHNSIVVFSLNASVVFQTVYVFSPVITRKPYGSLPSDKHF